MRAIRPSIHHTNSDSKHRLRSYGTWMQPTRLLNANATATVLAAHRPFLNAHFDLLGVPAPPAGFLSPSFEAGLPPNERALLNLAPSADCAFGAAFSPFTFGVVLGDDAADALLGRMGDAVGVDLTDGEL